MQTLNKSIGKQDINRKNSIVSKTSDKDFRKRSFSISYKNLKVKEGNSIIEIDSNFIKRDLLTDNHRLKLEKVLKAYALYDCEVNYAQGLNYITANLLMYIDKESDCFWFLYQLMNKYQLRELFIDNTPKLSNLLHSFFKTMKIKLPGLYYYFKEIEFIKFMKGVISHYFITLFTYNVYVEFSKYVLDYFLIKNEQVLIDTLIHLIYLKEEFLLSLNFEEAAVNLKNDFVNNCIEEFGVEGCLPYDIMNNTKV